MPIRVVRLGSARSAGEGLRIGTVRRPPRGVKKEDFAAQDWYDLWFPELAPSAALVKLAQGAQTPDEWAAFAKRFRAEMRAPACSRTLDLLAALSHQTNFSRQAVGRAGIDDQFGILDELGGGATGGVNRDDLIVVAVDDERGHVKLFQVFSEIGFRKSLDAVMRILMTAHHPLQPERINHALRNLCPRPVEAEKWPARDVFVKLRAIGD
jgi:uncharacterized protein YeaO (DUF488 family)